MSEKEFRRGLENGHLKEVIDFLRKEHQYQITKNLDKYHFCIRDNYINVYSNGCSLLKYSPNSQKTVEVHYKYFNSEGYKYSEKSPYVRLCAGEKIDLNWNIIRQHSPEEAEKVKIANYLREQKNEGNFLLLDLEVAFTRKRSTEETEKAKTKKELIADRIDMACIYLKDSNPILKLIEVKLTNDKRLKSDQHVIPYKKPEIIEQMQHYQDFIEEERNNIENSYKTVAANYHELISQDIIPENYFSSIEGISPKKILERFMHNPQIEERPYLLLLGKNSLIKGRKEQNHWQRLLELFLANKYPEPELWPAAEQCE